MKLLLWLLAVCTLSIQLSAQTVGIGDVTSIESKAKQMLAAKDRIKVLEAEILQVQGEWQAKLKKLTDELAALIKERDDIIADMKVGAKCSQCGKYKSEFEKKGENFQKHLGDVKGYAIPATTEELEAVRTRYRELIAYKKVQLQNLEKQNPVTQKKNEIAKLEENIKRWCAEITGHSKSYETRVFADATAKHNNWLGDIFTRLAKQHIAEDKASLAKARIEFANKKYQSDVAKAKARHQQEVAAKKQELTGRALALKEQLETATDAFNSQLKAIDSHIADLQQQLTDVATKLKSTGISEQAGQSLQQHGQQVNNSMAQAKNDRLALTNGFASEEKNLKGKILLVDDELWELQREVTLLQRGHVIELNELKEAFDKQKETLTYTMQESQKLAASLFTDVIKARNEYKQKNIIYVNEIVDECNRMLTAAQPVGCFVHNDIRFKVAQNYNTQEACANTYTASTLGRSFSSTATGCVVKFPSYISTYKTFASGLSPTDVQVIQNTTFYSWYNSILTQ